MSKFLKKSKKRNREILRMNYDDTTLLGTGDLNDSKKFVRQKKKGNLVNQMLQQVKKLNLAEDNQTWETKLEALDADIGIRKIEVKKLNSDCTIMKANIKEVEDHAPENIFPFEIWSLISEYIAPEDVGKFAVICQNTLAVVNTAKFWMNLYKRYYKYVPNLPEQLQPKCMKRRYSLRPRVIRALYYFYPPFTKRIHSRPAFSGDPHILIKRSCVLACYQQIKDRWVFSFKLKEAKPTEYNTCKKKPNLLDLLEDINDNRDEDCKVLVVTCQNYINLPMLTGQTLVGASLNVSNGMTSKLRLDFGCGAVPVASNSVVFNPVANVQVLNWWHPSFLHSEGLDTSRFCIDNQIELNSCFEVVDDFDF